MVDTVCLSLFIGLHTELVTSLNRNHLIHWSEFCIRSSIECQHWRCNPLSFDRQRFSFHGLNARIKFSIRDEFEWDKTESIDKWLDDLSINARELCKREKGKIILASIDVYDRWVVRFSNGFSLFLYNDRISNLTKSHLFRRDWMCRHTSIMTLFDLDRTLDAHIHAWKGKKARRSKRCWWSFNRLLLFHTHISLLFPWGNERA